MPDRRAPDQSSGGFPAWTIDFLGTLRQLRDQGAGDSAQATMLRIVWLRQQVDGVSITTEAIRIEPDLVVMQARVTMPDGTTGSGLAAEQPAGHASPAAALETAETRAIGRALDVLGLILPPEETTRSRPEPIRQTERPRPTPPPENEDPPAVVDALRRAARNGPRTLRPVEDEPGPIEGTTAPPARFNTPTPFPQRTGGETVPDDDDTPAMEDVTWTAFWRWARSKGLMRKNDVEQRIGRSIDDLSPAQVRQALRETGVEL